MSVSLNFLGWSASSVVVTVVECVPSVVIVVVVPHSVR